MIPKHTDTSIAIHSLFTSRYSGVSFDPEREVSEDILRGMAEAARWAPSCFGDQPWRFLICDRFRNPEAWQKAFDCLMEGNQAWCKDVPVLIITCCDTLLTRNDKPNPFHAYDSGAAAVSMCLQAISQGVMTHQMGGFVADKARESFAIPERYKPMAMMAVGYQLPEERLPEKFREKELAARKRDPLDTHFFAGAWGKGI